MYFPECAHLATEQPGLTEEISQIDRILHEVQSSGGVLRAADVAGKLRFRESVVSGIFEKLSRAGLLKSVSYVECPTCQTLTDREDFERAVADKDECDCSKCGLDLTKAAGVYPLLFHRINAPKVKETRPNAEELIPAMCPAVATDFCETLPDWVGTNPFTSAALLNYYSKDTSLIWPNRLRASACC